MKMLKNVSSTIFFLINHFLPHQPRDGLWQCLVVMLWGLPKRDLEKQSR